MANGADQDRTLQAIKIIPHRVNIVDKLTTTSYYSSDESVDNNNQSAKVFRGTGNMRRHNGGQIGLHVGPRIHGWGERNWGWSVGSKGRGQNPPISYQNYQQGWDEVQDFQPIILPFTENPWPNGDYQYLTPLEVFQLFFDDEEMDLLVTQTNIYAGQSNPPDPVWRAHPINTKEIKSFIALIMVMGVWGMPRYDMYWSTSGPEVTNPKMSQVFDGTNVGFGYMR